MGIDLGTTNSVIALLDRLDGGVPVVIPNAEGSLLTPSVVAFPKSGEVLVGVVAKRQAIINPDRTVRDVTRQVLMDRSTRIDDNTYTAPQIAAMILRKLKVDAEAFLGGEVTKAVLAVPAYYNDTERQAVAQAGEIAGLEVLRILSEPTAAALAYGLDEVDRDRKVLVYDLGGRGFDVSILEIGDGVFEILATAGDTTLGGDDWHQRVVEWLITGFKDEHGIDLGKDPIAVQRLTEAAEKAKIELSSAAEAEVDLPFITAVAAGPLHLRMSLTRTEFERLTEDLLTRITGPFHQAIEDSQVPVGDLDYVIAVGGSTRMPAITSLVQALTGRDSLSDVSPDEAVAIGAAIQAGVLTGLVETGRGGAPASPAIESQPDPEAVVGAEAAPAADRRFTEEPAAAVQPVDEPAGRVFICYARADETIVREIARALQAKGVATWVDKEDIPFGANWDRSIDEAIHAAACILVFLSPQAVASDEVQAEWNLAVEEGKPIVPLLLEDCAIPRRLRARQHIDLRARPVDGTRVSRLAAGLGKTYGVAPDFEAQPRS